MSKAQNNSGKWIRTALLPGAVAAWQIYDISTATEALRQALMLMQYFLLALALISCVGSLVMLASQK
jgi:hypothetical protein